MLPPSHVTTVSPFSFSSIVISVPFAYNAPSLLLNDSNKTRFNTETNNYIPRILLLLKKYQPDFQITDNFKKELDEIFQIKDVLNETKQQS